MQLPFGLSLTSMQTRWKSILDPLLRNPSVQSIILVNVPLVAGTTVVNHLLGRNLVGYRVILKNASSSIWDGQTTNQTPNLTLILNSSAACIVNLEVF